MTVKSGQKRRGRVIRLILGTVLLIFLGLYLWIGPTLTTAWRRGFFDQTPERTYTATQIGNLKAIYAALKSYHDSEGQFPDAKGWMDAIEHRLQSADLSKPEAEKKLIDPSLKGDGFGWAFNDAASMKYVDDIKDPKKTLLVFSSSDVSRNAHGIPEKLLPVKPRAGGNLGITVSGEIVNLSGVRH